MSAVHRTPVIPVLIAALAAIVLWWSLPEARPRDRVENPHEGIACAGCHMSSAAEASPAAATAPQRPGAASARDHRCAACHAGLQRVSTLAAVFHGPDGDACTRCHTFHDPGLMKAGAKTFRYAFGKPAVRMQCASCHREGGDLGKVSDGHRDAAASIYHVDSARLEGLSPSKTCLRCHSRGGGDPALPASAATAPRFHAEATHAFGETLPLGYATGGYSIRREPDPRILLFGGRIECATCHSVADDVEDLLVRFENKYDMCLGCHERHPSGRVTSLAANTEPSPSSDSADLN